MEREKLTALVTAVQAGKDGAAGELYNAFYEDIYYHILKTVDTDPELAADLTQDTFMEILETIGDLKEPLAFVTWSKQIAYHKCTAYFRKRREILLDEQEDGYSPFDTLEEDRAEFIPDEAMDKEDFRQTIQAMISELPQEQRSALLLRYFNEISVKEIAQIQGVTEGTVKSRLNYARKAIKQAVEAYEAKCGIRLHCAGVVPMLLWFFRAYRRTKGVAITVGSASAVFAASETAAVGAGAAGTAAAAKTGIFGGIRAFAQTLAGKIVAGATAVAVVAGGTAVVLHSQKAEPVEPVEPDRWAGYVEEFTDVTGEYPDITLLTVEGGRMFFELEVQEVLEDRIITSLEVTWENGETYQSAMVLTDPCETRSSVYYTGWIDPLFLRTPTDAHPNGDYAVYQLSVEYMKDMDAIRVGKDIRYLSGLDGELTRESGESSVLAQPPKERYLRDAYNDSEVLFYDPDTDAWVPYEEYEARRTQALDSGNSIWTFYKRPEDDWACAQREGWYSDDIRLPAEVGGVPVRALAPMYGYTYYSQVELPDSLKILLHESFCDFHLLQSLEIPAGVETIENAIVIYGNSLTQVTIPEGVKRVGAFPFVLCNSLRELSFPASMEVIDGSAVFGCPALESITVAEGNERYHSSENCLIETRSGTLITGCKTSRIPEDGSVTVIGRYAFAANYALTELVIPEGVEKIEAFAFAKCTALEQLHLPATLRHIDDNAFKLCTDLRDIYYGGTVEEFESIRGIRWNGEHQDFRLTVHCSDGTLTID